MPSERTKNRVWRGAAAVFVTVGCAILFGNDVIRAAQGERESRSHGTASNGSLERGVRFPTSGPNFKTYSRLGSLVGRTAAHSDVVDASIAAYDSLADTHPEHEWVFGESGWPWGGEFWPHRTHQNGMVVDYMTPVLQGGEPTTLSTWPWDGFGYRHDFDSRGRNETYEIDFDGLAAHLSALDAAARARGMRIRKVILAPELRKEMLRRPAAADIRRLPYSRTPVWVRHDDHYHVEFEHR